MCHRTLASAVAFLLLAVIAHPVAAQSAAASERQERPERRFAVVFGPNVLWARTPGASRWELGLGGTLGLEARAGSRWGGIRHFGAETEMLGNTEPDPQGTAIFAGLQRRTPIGTVRVAAGPELRHRAIFGMLAMDWLTTRVAGIGVEAFGVTGSEAMVGTSLRISVGVR